MPSLLERSIALPGTREELARSILSSFGFLHYEDDGTHLTLHDGERRMEIDIVPPPGNDDLGHAQPGQLIFSFLGYSEQEADQLVEQYLWHGLSDQHGMPVRSFDDE